MAEKEFNLQDEPWIRVVKADCTVREVSLREALFNAHTYSSLAGEMPTQDIAVLRTLLAVVHTIFSRMDENGEKRAIQDADDALDCWETLWNLGYFPEKPIQMYLEEWHERFYLFHPDKPFYQANEAADGREFKAAKLNGAISESGNKERLFSMRKGERKERLTYAEAARWLINLNGFDDAAAKTKTGVGWLGKIGLIAAEGENLFETLMLNFVMLNQNGEIWKTDKPIWEREKPRTGKTCEIPMPDNLAELYTLQSRKLLLIRDGNNVTDYKVSAGEVFDENNAFAEPMTMWKRVEGKGSQIPVCKPKTHDSSKQIWREFSAIVPEINEESANGKHTTKISGVVKWQQRLRNEGILDKNGMARFAIASVEYGSSNSSVKDIFSDSLSFHLDLLTDAGADWVEAVEAEIRLTDKVAAAVLYLGMDIDKAAGGDGDALGKQLKEQFYDRIDVPFRRFLEAVDPQDDEDQMHERLERWHEEEWRIAYGIAREIVSQEDRANFIIGNTIKEKQNGKDVSNRYSVPEAYKRFKYQINRLLKNEKGAAE